MTNQAIGVLQHVRIAEIKVASQGFLKATLGSCVAIALVNRETGVCGLAHCLLPAAPPGVVQEDARFVDQAVANLVRAVGPDECRRKLKAYLSGGSRMIAYLGASRVSVGELNVAAAETALNAHQIRFKVLDVGGSEACQLVVDCQSLTVSCRRVSNYNTKEPEGLDEK